MAHEVFGHDMNDLEIVTACLVFFFSVINLSKGVGISWWLIVGSRNTA